MFWLSYLPHGSKHSGAQTEYACTDHRDHLKRFSDEDELDRTTNPVVMIISVFCSLSSRIKTTRTLPDQIIYDLVRSHDDPESANVSGGCTNRAASQLSTAFRDHIFCPAGGQSANPQAVALGVEALNFLRGRQVCRRFLQLIAVQCVYVGDTEWSCRVVAGYGT